jgi:hypothetical protein
LNAGAIGRAEHRQFLCREKAKMSQGNLVRHHGLAALSEAMCDGCRPKHDKLISIGCAKV